MSSTNYCSGALELLSLPNEILTNIVAQTVASMNLVDLTFLVNKPSCANPKDTLHHVLATPLCSSEDYSKAWKLASLEVSHIEHYMDWLFVNGTCHRIRAIGKRLFFALKRFIVFSTRLHKYQRRQSTSTSLGSWEFARKEIRDVVAITPDTCPLVDLPRYHIFPALRRMTIQPSKLSPGYSFHFTEHWDEGILFIPPPAELLNQLRKLELRVDGLKIDILVDTNKYRKEDVLDWLQSDVYRYLDFIAGMGKTAESRRKFIQSLEHSRAG